MTLSRIEQNQEPLWTPDDGYAFESTQELMTEIASFYARAALDTYDSNGESDEFQKQSDLLQSVLMDKNGLDVTNRAQVETTSQKYLKLLDELRASINERTH